ncbi:MAG TPA: hypothetical protein VFR29_02455 [Steroidobacteraceae bacterium]|nr:hypothetical protein [Steroidobacteraceae bacterium]
MSGKPSRDRWFESTIRKENGIVGAARRLHAEDGELVEGAAAVAVAAFPKAADAWRGKTMVLLLCGGNAEPEFETKILEN